MIEIDYREFVESGRQEIDSELADQLRNLGCFIFINCFPVEETKRVHVALETLFSLSEAEKMVHYVDKRKNPLGNGFSPFGVSRALDTKIANLLETWDISLDMTKWPPQLRNEWEAIILYQQRLKEVSIACLQIMADALGVPRQELLSFIDPNEKEGIHLIHYFPVKEEHDAMARRQSEHFDNTLLTLIPAPNPVQTGIEVYDKDRMQWDHLEIPLGACLAQAGLVLELVTKKLVTANLHTVQQPKPDDPENGHRYSTPFFVSPKRGTEVKVLPSLNPSTSSTDLGTIEEIEKDYFDDIFGDNSE